MLGGGLWSLGALLNLSREQSSLLYLSGTPRVVVLDVTGANKGLVHKAESLTQFLKGHQHRGMQMHR